MLERLARAGPGDPSDPASGPPPSTRQSTTGIVSRLAIGTGDHTLRIDAADVIWIEAEDYYVRLHTKRGRHLMRASMSYFEERLDPRSFVRSHRRAIVNLREVRQLMDGASTLLMSDGAQVAISRSRRPWNDCLAHWSAARAERAQGTPARPETVSCLRIQRTSARPRR